MDRLIRLETFFQLKNVFPFLLIIPLVSKWLVWQDGKHSIWTFFRVQFWVPWGTCPLKRGPPKERHHCIVTTLSPSPPPPVYSYQKRFQSPVVWPKTKTVTLINCNRISPSNKSMRFWVIKWSRPRARELQPKRGLTTDSNNNNNFIGTQRYEIQYSPPQITIAAKEKGQPYLGNSYT